METSVCLLWDSTSAHATRCSAPQKVYLFPRSSLKFEKVTVSRQDAFKWEYPKANHSNIFCSCECCMQGVSAFGKRKHSYPRDVKKYDLQTLFLVLSWSTLYAFANEGQTGHSKIALRMS